jgi:2-dehydro-3-deoxygluconokinase
MDRARRANATVSFDVNYRSALGSIADAADALRELLPLVDILFFGEDELPVVRAATGPGSDPIGALHAAGVREVVVKRGSRGASVHADTRQVDAPALSVPAVDTVGAGDAFVAGYLSAHLDGGDIPDRLHRATATAAFCVASHGDWEGLPTRDEIPLLGLAPDVTLR